MHDYAGLLSARCFLGFVSPRCLLGFVEAAFFPGALCFLSMSYNRKQFAMRTAILYSSSQMRNAFGGLLAIAILKLDGSSGLEGWRWVSVRKCFSVEIRPRVSALLG